VIRESENHWNRFVKTTIDIPENELSDVVRFTRAKTKQEAVVTAIADFNRRRRMAELVQYAGTCPDMMTVEELRAQRWERPEAADSGLTAALKSADKDLERLGKLPDG